MARAGVWVRVARAGVRVVRVRLVRVRVVRVRLNAVGHLLLEGGHEHDRLSRVLAGHVGRLGRLVERLVRVRGRVRGQGQRVGLGLGLGLGLG